MNEEQLRAELDAVYGSLSWKITTPLRLLSKSLRSVKSGGLRLRSFSIRVARFVVRQPLIRQLGKVILNYFPGVKRRLRGLLFPALVPVQITQANTPVPVLILKTPRSGPASLSPQARQIWNQLQAEVRRFK